jgi:hypothetical protein
LFKYLPRSSSIGDYDLFVTGQANLNADLLALGTTWQAIASAGSDVAFTHIGGAFDVPVYVTGYRLRTASRKG